MGRGAKRGTRSPEGEEGESRQQAKDKDRFLNVASHQVRISTHDSALILLRQRRPREIAEECEHHPWKGLVSLPSCLVFGRPT